MGGVESSEGVQIHDYKYEMKADKAVYGDAKIYSKGNQSMFVIKEKHMEDEKTKLNFENYIEENLKHEKIEFFTTKEACVAENKGTFCGTCASSTKLVVVMNFIERNLYGEIQRRQLQNVNFKFLLTKFRIHTPNLKFGMF